MQQAKFTKKINFLFLMQFLANEWTKKSPGKGAGARL